MNVSPSLLSAEARQANEQKKEAAQRVREEFKPPGVVSCVISSMRPDVALFCRNSVDRSRLWDMGSESS